MHQENKAYQYGAAAFSAGLGCVPALDVDYSEWIGRQGMVVGEGISHHKAWQAGWLNADERNAIQRAIQELVAGYSEDGISPEGINNGYCADVAHYVVESAGTGKVVGIYDPEDIPDAASPEFAAAVRAGDIGHSAIFHAGIYYDAETIDGVSSFELLPCVIRAMEASGLLPPVY